MASEPNENGDTLHLERFVMLLKTPLEEVCRLLDLDEDEPSPGISVGMSVFTFDPEVDFVFTGAVMMDDEFGFYGVRVGEKWLDAAERLESVGFVQAGDAEQFTLAGSEVGVSVHLYPDKYNDPGSAKVHHYSVGPAYDMTSD